MLYYIIILLLLVIVALLYRHHRATTSLRAIENGIDLLRAQDTSTRLRRTGNASTDRIVDLFNTLMNQLKDERLHVREQNHFLDLLISSSPMGVIITDFDGHITSCNASALAALGMARAEDVLGQTMAAVSSPLAAAIAHLPMGSSDTVRLNDFHIYRVSHLCFIDHGFKHPFVLIESFTDELVKAEKRAYEKVIRMMAHEVNNSAAGINSMLEQLKTDADAREADLFDVLIHRSEELSTFVTRLADVVRLPEPQLAPTDLNLFVRNALPFVQSLCAPHDIAVSLHLCDPSPRANLDATLMQQVLVNIVKNAAESIGRGGDITITTTAAPATIEVTDNGSGITPEQQLHLFTPFYSTKRDGQGIGLLVVRETLMRHGCTFSLRTHPDSLTRFRIEFPS